MIATKTKRDKLRLEVIQGEKKDTGTSTITHIEIDASYDKGGVAIFSGRNKPRGYYLSVGPIKVEDRGTGEIVSFILFSGAPAVFLEGAKRLDRKREVAIRERIFQEAENKQGKVWELVQQVCTKHNLTVKE